MGVRPSGFEIERDLDRIGTSRCFGEDVGDLTGDYLFRDEEGRTKTKNEPLLAYVRLAKEKEYKK